MSAQQEAFGLDFGSSSCCIGIFQDKIVNILPNEDGNRVTASLVSTTEEDLLVGDIAKAQIIRNASNCIYDAKRILGLVSEDAQSVQQHVQQEKTKHKYPFSVTTNADDGTVSFDVDYKNERHSFTLQKVLTLIIEKMKKSAESYLGKQVNNVCMSVPIFFTPFQRQFLTNAAQAAGFNVLALLEEPVAAAIAYKLDSNTSAKNVLVLDIGACKSAATIINIDEGVMEIRGNAVNRNVAGREFDDQLINLCIQEFQRKYKENLSDNKKAMAKLRSACEKAKIVLSSSQSANVDCDSLHSGIDFKLNVSRARFEIAIQSQLQQCCTQLIQQALVEAALTKTDISDVILVGGGSSIPKVQTMLADFFGQGVNILKSITPEEVVANGTILEATILAEELSSGSANQQKQQVSIAVAPFTIGLEDANGKFIPMISRGTKLPAMKRTLLSVPSTLSSSDALLVSVYQAETAAQDAKSHTMVGQVAIQKQKITQEGAASVEIQFSLDEQGGLQTSLVDGHLEIPCKMLVSSSYQTATITTPSTPTTA